MIWEGEDCMNQYKSKVDMLYDKILNKIKDGDYPPGRRLVISRIAKEYQVSDIPVREALRRLESAGVVEIIANQGVQVARFDTQEVMQFYLAYSILLGYAARISADYLREEDFQCLTELNEQMQVCVETGNNREFNELNNEFHNLILSAIPYVKYREQAKQLWDRRIQYDAYPMIKKPTIKQAVKEHDRILFLLRQKKYDQIEAHFRKHMLRPLKNIINLKPSTEGQRPN